MWILASFSIAFLCIGNVIFLNLWFAILFRFFFFFFFCSGNPHAVVSNTCQTGNSFVFPFICRQGKGWHSSYLQRHPRRCAGSERTGKEGHQNLISFSCPPSPFSPGVRQRAYLYGNTTTSLLQHSSIMTIITRGSHANSTSSRAAGM